MNEEALRRAGLDDFEVIHALDNLDVEYGPEHVVRTVAGRQVRCPAYPATCDYARVTTEVDGVVVEIAYWDVDEMRREPAEVLGAMLGTLGGLIEQPAATPPAEDGEAPERADDVYKSVLEVTVLHQAPCDAAATAQGNLPLARILGEMDDGDMVGTVRRRGTTRVAPADVDAELRLVGNDGSFFG